MMKSVSAKLVPLNLKTVLIEGLSHDLPSSFWLPAVLAIVLLLIDPLQLLLLLVVVYLLAFLQDNAMA